MSDDQWLKARVLIVDDQAGNIALLKSLLGARGLKHLHGTQNPRETLRLVREWLPDIILLDLNMPGMSGLDVLRLLQRELPPENFLPILVLTGETDPRMKNEALEIGATDLLLKPFNSVEVLARLRNLLKTRLLHQEVQNQNLALEEKVAQRTFTLEETLAELRMTQQQLLRQERLLAFSEMAGGVVHDFNNSLMAVIGYSELLLSSPDLIHEPATVIDFLKIMNTSGRDAAHVVSRLRDFYRPREICDVFTPLDLNEQLERAIPLTQPKWKDQALSEGRSIVIEKDFEKVPFVSANESELRQVLTNLIFNAVDAMPSGGTITLRSRRSEGGAYFEVADSGIGMTEEVRSHCLEPFFSTKGERGTGLGLSTVFGIVKRHQATIELQSEPGRGTAFRIHLPAATPPEAVISALPTSDRPLQILVVDDEPVTRDVVTRFLKMDGHQVTTVQDAPDALLEFAHKDFDLLLTDQAMPCMNGLQLATAAKVMTDDSMPVILLTGFGPANLKKEGDLSEVDRVVAKPVPRAELQRAVAETRAAHPASPPGEKSG